MIIVYDHRLWSSCMIIIHRTWLQSCPHMPVPHAPIVYARPSYPHCICPSLMLMSPLYMPQSLMPQIAMRTSFCFTKNENLTSVFSRETISFFEKFYGNVLSHGTKLFLLTLIWKSAQPRKMQMKKQVIWKCMPLQNITNDPNRTWWPFRISRRNDFDVLNFMCSH